MHTAGGSRNNQQRVHRYTAAEAVTKLESNCYSQQYIQLAIDVYSALCVYICNTNTVTQIITKLELSSNSREYRRLAINLITGIIRTYLHYTHKCNARAAQNIEGHHRPITLRIRS